ncbi:MAG TPA: hypothetical protein PK971_16325, partial [Saprospiraceae bacterium]|nr:hypothetical protein [Saprospiraceae bacterium]
MHRLILYKQIGPHWQYVRLTVASPQELLTELGTCGQQPKSTQISSFPLGTDAVQALRQAGASWVEQGYHKPNPKTLPVLTLHFQMPRWTGYPAGAPWYDDWTSSYLDPIQAALAATCNGIAKGHERFSGNHLYYYTVLNADAAHQAVADIAATALVKFPLHIHLGDEEKPIKIPLDPNIPDYLRSLFRTVEKTARLLARELPGLLPADPLQPEQVATNHLRRVRGEESLQLRRGLKEKWNFDSNWWNPLVEASPSEVVFLNGITDDKKMMIETEVRRAVSRPLYLLDCDAGLFEISPDHIFDHNAEGIVFDGGLGWVIYFSHHYTTTFGGDWLVKAVAEAYRDE